jgi:hypothetical protein
VEQNTMVTLRHLKPAGLGRYFKADAKAEGMDVVVGGLEILPGSTLENCRWFSFRLSPELTPWAYYKQNEAYRTIATLELFATLLCVMLFLDVQPLSKTSVLFYTGVTDNQGNESAVLKASSSKFPLYLIHLELTEQLKSKNVALDLRWQRRDKNVAADSLTNGSFEQFSEQYRLNPDLNSLEWKVLPRLLSEALALEQTIRDRKACIRSTAAKNAVEHRISKRKRAGLKVTDPW